MQATPNLGNDNHNSCLLECLGQSRWVFSSAERHTRKNHELHRNGILRAKRHAVHVAGLDIITLHMWGLQQRYIRMRRNCSSLEALELINHFSSTLSSWLDPGYFSQIMWVCLINVAGGHSWRMPPVDRRFLGSERGMYWSWVYFPLGGHTELWVAHGI